MNATDQMERIDKRRLRAMVLTSQIMQIVGKHVPYDRERDILRDISYALQEAMKKVGAEIVSDFDRQQYGLPPRGPDGWTMEEIMELEKRRFEIMYATRPPMIVASSPLPGEMTAQEMRTARAVAKGIESAIVALSRKAST